jgi:hypothetical protein
MQAVCILISTLVTSNQELCSIKTRHLA